MKKNERLPELLIDGYSITCINPEMIPTKSHLIFLVRSLEGELDEEKLNHLYSAEMRLHFEVIFQGIIMGMHHWIRIMIDDMIMDPELYLEIDMVEPSQYLAGLQKNYPADYPLCSNDPSGISGDIPFTISTEYLTTHNRGTAISTFISTVTILVTVDSENVVDVVDYLIDEIMYSVEDMIRDSVYANTLTYKSEDLLLDHHLITISPTRYAFVTFLTGFQNMEVTLVAPDKITLQKSAADSPDFMDYFNWYFTNLLSSPTTLYYATEISLDTGGVKKSIMGNDLISLNIASVRFHLLGDYNNPIEYNDGRLDVYYEITSIEKETKCERYVVTSDLNSRQKKLFPAVIFRCPKAQFTTAYKKLHQKEFESKNYHLIYEDMIWVIFGY